MELNQERLGQIIQYITMAATNTIIDLEFDKKELSVPEKEAVDLFNAIEKLEVNNPMLLSGNTLGLTEEEKMIGSLILGKMIQSVGNLYFHLKTKQGVTDNENKFIKSMNRIESEFKGVYETFNTVMIETEKNLGKTFIEYANAFYK